jgi:spermidine synthase
VHLGGLGLGFTLRAVLDRVGPGARVTVSELVPAVVRWNRERFPHLAGAPLDDPRVQVREGDVGEHLTGEGGAFDAVLLDVDNGPVALSVPSNAGLYGPAGLRRLRRALVPGGVLAVWSSGPDGSFEGRLAREGFRVERHAVALRLGGPRHAIILLGWRGDE